MSSDTAGLVVAYCSGYGHTRKLAEAVLAGAASLPGCQAHLLNIATIGAADWDHLAAARAIVFGAPTYMGGPAAAFKVFADASSKVWLTQGWKDKLAGGFTCSLALSGDKMSTLNYFQTLAMQHGMIWVGTGMLPSTRPGDPASLNRLGAYAGVMAQADNVPPEQSPPKGDLDTGYAYGLRLATLSLR